MCYAASRMDCDGGDFGISDKYQYFLMTPIEHIDVLAALDEGKKVCMLMKAADLEVSLSRFLSVVE